MPRAVKRSRSVAQLETELEDLGVDIPKDKSVSIISFSLSLIHLTYPYLWVCLLQH